MQGVLPYQSLLDKKAEENGIAHFSEALEHIGLQLCILNDVLQLMVEKLQDSLKTRRTVRKARVESPSDNLDKTTISDCK